MRLRPLGHLSIRLLSLFRVVSSTVERVGCNSGSLATAPNSFVDRTVRLQYGVSALAGLEGSTYLAVDSHVESDTFVGCDFV